MDASVRSRSLILSLLVHGAIFLALFFLIMTTPIPPFPEVGGGSGGVIVNIGYVESAQGDVQPMSENTTMNPEANKPAPVKQQEENIATQETEESPISKEKHDVKSTSNKAKTDIKIIKEKKTTETVRNVDPRSMYKGKTNSSKSQGTGQGTGDQGNPQGDPNSKYTGKNGNGTGPGSGEGTGTGTGPGNGPSFNLSGRKMLKSPVINDKSQETGKVVLQITVDKSGTVTEATIERGTTTTSTHLHELAIKAARETKFTPSSAGQEIQRGTITFVFVVQ